MTNLQAWTPVIAAGVAVVGWLVTYKLTSRAQKTNLQNQILNTARESVIGRLREYQEWLSEMKGLGMSLRLALPLDGTPLQVDWLKRMGESLAKFYDDRSLRWIYALEEYELVFPETRAARLFLYDRQVEGINPRINQWVGAFASANERPAVFGDGRGTEVFSDQQSNVEYLRVAVQNLSLGRIMDRTQPIPEPTEPGRYRLELQRDGMLRYVLSDAESAERGRAIQGPVDPSHTTMTGSG
jgi:hypothetical protein